MNDAAAGKEEQVSVKSEDVPSSLGTTRLIKGEGSKKATNKDLPPNALAAFRHVVATLRHWAAGNAPDPFNIDEDSLINALVITWKHMYADKVALDIPLVVSLVRERQLSLTY